MMIRYFASTDDSPTGRIALAYLKGMLKIARVRVLSMSSGMSVEWERYSATLATPMLSHATNTVPDFVNVVCCEQARWIWTHHIQAPLRAGGFETITSKAELYTVGVRNVLIADDPPTDPEQLRTAERYQDIVTSNVKSAAAWLAAAWIQGNGRPPAVIPTPVTDVESLRRAILS
jgi:hypothetical protein